MERARHDQQRAGGGDCARPRPKRPAGLESSEVPGPTAPQAPRGQRDRVPGAGQKAREERGRHWKKRHKRAAAA